MVNKLQRQVGVLEKEKTDVEGRIADSLALVARVVQEPFDAAQSEKYFQTLRQIASHLTGTKIEH